LGWLKIAPDNGVVKFVMDLPKIPKHGGKEVNTYLRGICAKSRCRLELPLHLYRIGNHQRAETLLIQKRGTVSGEAEEESQNKKKTFRE
jgi:hypothetical protein